MRWTLLLRLAGPMQAWGVQSRFEIRDTVTEPSKSGVIGLVCAALGVDRSEPIPPEIRSLRMGVRVDRPGEMRRDYQTATRWSVDRKTKEWMPGSTTLSERWYLADASFLVGLESSDANLLTSIDEAVQRPHWPLCLGRRAFPPGRPLHILGGLVEGELEKVLAVHPWEDRSKSSDVAHSDASHAGTRKHSEMPPRLRAVIELRNDQSTTLPDVLVHLRRPDEPLSFAPRHFVMRDVAVVLLDNPSFVCREEEVSHVSE